jgi:hypothetical protein
MDDHGHRSRANRELAVLPAGPPQNCGLLSPEGTTVGCRLSGYPGGPAARPRVVTRGLRCRTATAAPYPKVVSTGFLDVGMGHGGSWRCRSSWSGGRLAGCSAGRSATVKVAAWPPAVCLWPELAFQLRQAPDLDRGGFATVADGLTGGQGGDQLPAECITQCGSDSW